MNRFGTTKFIGKNPLSFYDSSGNIRNNFEATELVIPSDVNICFFELWGADSQAKGQDDFESQKPGALTGDNADPTIIAGCDQIDDGDNYQSHNSVSSDTDDYVIHHHSSTSIIDNLNSELRTHGRGAYLRGFFLCNPGDYLYIGIGETNIERLGTHGTRDSGHYIDVGSDPPEVGNVTTFNGGGCGQRRFSRGGNTQTDLTWSAKPGFSGGGCSFISYLPSGSSDNQRNASKMELYRYRRVGTSAISENFTRIIAVAGGGGGKGSEEDGGGGGNGGAMYGAPLNINGSIDGSLVQNTQTSEWANALTASPDYDFDTTNKVEDTNGNEIGFVINGTFGQRHKDGNTSRKGGGGGGIKGGQSPGDSFNGTNFFDGSGHDGIFGFGGGRPLERGPLSDDKASASSSATNISGQDFSNYDIGSGTAESKFYTDTDSNGMPTANIGRGHLSPINHNRSAFQGGGGGGGFFGGHTASAAGGGGGGGSSYVKLHGAASGILSKTNCDAANQYNISTSNSFNDFYPTGSTLPRFYEVKVQRSSVRTGVKHSSIPYFDHTNYQEYDSIDTTGGGAGVHSDRYTQTRGHGGCVMMFKQISSVPSTNLVLQVITVPTNFRRTLTFWARAYENSDVNSGSNWWPGTTGKQNSNRTNTPPSTGGRKISALFQSKMPYGFVNGTYQTELVYRGAENPDYTPEPIDIIISNNSASGPTYIYRVSQLDDEPDNPPTNLTTDTLLNGALAPPQNSSNNHPRPILEGSNYETRYLYQVGGFGPDEMLDYESDDNVHTAIHTNTHFSGMVNTIRTGEVSIFPAGQDKYIHTDGYYNGTDVSEPAVSGVIKINSMPLGYRVGDILKISHQIL